MEVLLRQGSCAIPQVARDCLKLDRSRVDSRQWQSSRVNTDARRNLKHRECGSVLFLLGKRTATSTVSFGGCANTDRSAANKHSQLLLAGPLKYSKPARFPRRFEFIPLPALR